MKSVAGLWLLACASICRAESASDALAAGFKEPPAEARPLVFWQWVNGNVTQEGIRLDLEWMQRVGLAGALLFDVGFRTPPVPQFVEKRIGFGTPEWAQAIRFAASEAKRLGLALGAQSSGGWSVSGGPGVPPEQAMKKLVWSETIVTPATPLPMKLPSPPAGSGPYQDFPIDESFREPVRSGGVATIAYRLPEAEQIELPRPEISGVANAALLDDQRYSEAVELVPDAEGHATLSVRFAPGLVPRALTLAVRGRQPRANVEASNEGLHFRGVIELPGVSAQDAPVSTYALPESTGTHWRIRFSEMTRPLAIAEVRFEFGAHVDRAQEKAGFGVLADNAPSDIAAPANLVIDPRNVLDVSQKLAADGTLSWRPREGRWAVVRFGWSLTGRRTVPATAESIGLEVDKLDARAVRAFANTFYDRYAKAIGHAGALRIALTDSWEAGQQNWTPAMFEEFSTRRGYDLRAWLPVLTGRVVGDAARSERFLADYRRTIADLIAENHYGVLTQVAHERGMKTWAEAAGTDLPTIVDGIQAKGRVDVPMGEYWFYPEDGVPKPNHVADVREAASAAHLYAKPLVAAEALTTMGDAPWAQGPAQWRRIVDRFFAEGINRVVLHTSAHQPFTDRKPGVTLRQYGQHFTRNETWAEDAGAWVQYLARTSWLLQQGRPIADVAVFLGDDAALSPPFDRPGYPRRFAGFDHDFVNAEALGQLRVKDGLLTRHDGLGYRALVIAPAVRRMSLPTMTKLREWVTAGGILIGAKPLGAIGLEHDDEVRAIAEEIWSGRANVHAEQSLEDVMRAAKVPPDFHVLGMGGLHWTHRATHDADIYFISNQGAESFEGTVQFRVRGRRAEAWNAVDGSLSPLTYLIGEQVTGVHLELPRFASLFVVLRGETSKSHFEGSRIRTVLSTLQGPWNVEFLDGQGAPARVQFPALISWPESPDAAIRYYSGRAKYTRSISIPEAWRASDQRVELDLGEVGELAHVRVNDKDLGVLWSAPLRRDITDALRAGENQFEITVTNYWANRLIGDEQPGASRVTFAPIRPYTASSSLRRSGLSGPVRLVAATTVPAVVPQPPTWSTAIVRKDAAWYASPEARQIADSVLQYQSREGGWPKNTDLSTPPRDAADIPSDGRENTFDNNGTTLPLEFLAKVIHASPTAPYIAAFNRGLDYTLAAQYPNGGWPQFYPLREGYYSRVTFNDDAMIRVMTLLRDVASGKAPYEFVDAGRRKKSSQAVKLGIDLILRTQIRQEGALTAWCAQYDEHTLEPAWARKYEPPSLSGNESVGIVRLLMSIEKPTPAVIVAVEGAVKWLRASAIRGVRIERFANDAGEPDRRVVADAGAEPVWARFYELGTNRPIFLGRDSVYHYTFAEIERERRFGYNYYGTWARELLEREYPAWQARH